MFSNLVLLTFNTDVRLVGIQVATTDNIPEGASWFDIHQHYLCGYVEHIPISGTHLIPRGYVFDKRDFSAANKTGI